MVLYCTEPTASTPLCYQPCGRDAFCFEFPRFLTFEFRRNHIWRAQSEDMTVRYNLLKVELVLAAKGPPFRSGRCPFVVLVLAPGRRVVRNDLAKKQ